jgi:hypothetical protein
MLRALDELKGLAIAAADGEIQRPEHDLPIP